MAAPPALNGYKMQDVDGGFAPVNAGLEEASYTRRCRIADAKTAEHVNRYWLFVIGH
jgi:hypothetical protein